MNRSIQINGIEEATAEEIEEARLVALAAQELDRNPEPVFDAIANAAALLTNCPVALVTMMGSEKQWYKAQCGFSADETDREISLCSTVIDDRDVVESLDMSNDPRFRHNPFVSGAEQVRYYLGIPIHARNGQVLGTVCVIDRLPRSSTSPEIVKALKGLALAIEELLAARSLASQQRARLELLTDDTADEPELEVVEPKESVLEAEPKQKRSQWETVIRAAARGIQTNFDGTFDIHVEDVRVMRPPVIFARIVLGMLQEIAKVAGKGSVHVELKRQAGFVLFAVSTDGYIGAPHQELARWMRTEGGILNVKNEDGRARLLAWFPIISS